MRRHRCKECGVAFGGELPKGSKRWTWGCCDGCWALALERQRFNARRLYVERCTAAGLDEAPWFPVDAGATFARPLVANDGEIFASVALSPEEREHAAFWSVS